MNNLKGIYYGMYLNKKVKPDKRKQFRNLTASQICKQCENYKICKYGKIKKFEKDKYFENNIECPYLYFSATKKATIVSARDKTTGRETKMSFSGKTMEEAINNALKAKMELNENGGVRIITKSNKNIIDLISECIDESFRLGKIKSSTYKRKTDTMKKISQQKFTLKPIFKVTREDIIKYLEELRSYSTSTIKQVYEELCMAFGQAKYQNIITDNFMDGYNRVEKPKSNLIKNKRSSLTLDEQKTLVNYLTNISFEKCKHKYLLLLLLSTGMRIGEALALDYTNDIDTDNGIISIKRTLTKNKEGDFIVGDIPKTLTGIRVLHLNDIGKQILKKAYETKLPNSNHLLFCTDEKTIYAPNTINSFLKRLAINLNLGIYEDKDRNGNIKKKTDIHTHMLRGTFATRCAEAKIAPAVLMKILGHKSINITMKYYVDIDKEFELSEGKNVETYLMNKDIFVSDY